MTRHPIGTLLGRLAAHWQGRLSVRMLTAVVVVSTALAGLSSAYGRALESKFFEEQIVKFGSSLADTAALKLADALVVDDPTTWKELLPPLVLGSGDMIGCARVVKSDGRVVASYPETEPAGVVECARPIRVERDGEILGEIIVGLRRQPWSDALADRTRGIFVRTCVTSLLVVLLIAWLMNRLIGGPLTRLAGHARRLGEGALAEPIPGFGKDELGRLAATMEHMRANLLSTQSSLLQQNERLRELDRLKTQFLANVSHEIRTPITAILGCADLLADAKGEAAEVTTQVETLRRNGRTLMETVNSVLDLANLESGNLLVRLAPCHLRPVFEDVLTSLRPMAQQKNIGIELHWLGAAPEWIATDAKRLRQILGNVIGNAVKFTEHGRVDVAVDYAAAPPTLQIHVLDSGVGIPDSFKQRLFTPFSQADGSMTRRHGGTGLGLSITRRLLQLLDGELALDSVVGRGTWIRLRLRVRPIEAPAETAPVGKACTPTQELHAHVLLVDDAPDNLRLVSRILTKAGAVVDTAENGRIACDKVLAASAGAQPFDLIIMDVQMPDMDGCMATRLLRQHGVRTPIVALTAHAMAEDRQRCLDAGYDDYETKPIDRPRLLATLLRHVPPPATPV